MVAECIETLRRAGIAYDDATALRRIAMTLHRWHELECGSDSGAVERDETTGKTYWVNAMTGKRFPCADRERGALKRLEKIISEHNKRLVAAGTHGQALGYYVQGDPRGASLYILRPGDVPEGAEVDAYYSRGLAVYK